MPWLTVLWIQEWTCPDHSASASARGQQCVCGPGGARQWPQLAWEQRQPLLPGLSGLCESAIWEARLRGPPQPPPCAPCLCVPLASFAQGVCSQHARLFNAETPHLFCAKGQT